MARVGSTPAEKIPTSKHLASLRSNVLLLRLHDPLTVQLDRSPVTVLLHSEGVTEEAGTIDVDGIAGVLATLAVDPRLIHRGHSISVGT